jgi:hypothetical protein
MAPTARIRRRLHERLAPGGGIVTGGRSGQFWPQDPTPAGDAATSEGVLVIASGVGALVNVGDRVRVGGPRTGPASRPATPSR